MPAARAWWRRWRAKASQSWRKSSPRRSSRRCGWGGATCSHPSTPAALPPPPPPPSPQPALALLPHTYQVRDFAPKLAAAFRRALIADCIGFRREGGQTVFIRQMFQGKTNADILPLGAAPPFLTFQAGAFRGDQVKAGDKKAEVKKAAIKLDAAEIRTKPGELFREAKQAVDLSQAAVIVAVGRGIKAPEHLEMAKKLAGLLGGELGASRPICDEGWLPMERQIGSSGQTVAPPAQPPPRPP